MNQENQNTLHQQLKKQTVELHNQAHKIPYIINFLKNDISLISYVGHLRAVAIIYGTLEHQLSTLNNLDLKILPENYSPKLPLLLADLAFLKANEVKDILPAISNALHVADRIIINSIENPYKLLGYLYTLEGSLNGGSILKKHISQTFHFQNNDATQYLSCVDENFKSFWDNFIHNLNTKITEKEQKESILAASSEIFSDVMKIYEALSPIDEKTLGNHVTALNPEAGNHPIPTNPLEIKAAIAAGMNCWDEFPFYEQRYGERGRRFAVSDTAWLVTLSELDEVNVLQQVNWLANVLAVRGMPTYTMEYQLKVLCQELSTAIPENEQKYLKLVKASEDISNKRAKCINETDFENCNSIFNNHCKVLNVAEKHCLDLRKNTGKLIASDIVDHKNKIKDINNSFKTWLTSKDVFPENWILAVEKTYLEIERFTFKI